MIQLPLKQYILIPFQFQKQNLSPYKFLSINNKTNQYMNKENRNPQVKCQTCSNEATGINYRSNSRLDNALACTIHTTNFFIPFKNTNYDKKLLSESRYRSPIKYSQFSQISQITPLQSNPQAFFDKLMQNIISEFNTMKKQVMKNYNSMKNLQKSRQALNFRMQGDELYPYMLINNDQELMMSHFINRIRNKYDEQTQKIKRQNMAKQRMQRSTILFSTNLPHSNFADLKDVNSLFLSRSLTGSPQKLPNETSIEKSPQITERKSLMYRDYNSRTYKRQKK